MNLNVVTRIGILMSFLFFSSVLLAQNVEQNSEISFSQLESELQGKYQIQLIGVRTKPEIPQDLLLEIKNRQQQSERVYYDYRPHYRVLILSKDEVMNGTLIPQEEKIAYFN